jgi:glycosyltransferase involved in cell wall biosynthesis
VTLWPSGGFEVTYQLATLLSQCGYSVGLLFIRDIYKQLMRLHPSPELEKFNKTHRTYSIYSNLVNRKFGFIPKKIIRWMKGIHYDENFKGIEVFFSNGDYSPAASFGIANGWHNAIMVNNMKNIEKKYILAIQDDADARWTGELNNLAKFGLSLDIPMIAVNSKVMKKYGPKVVGKIPLSINTEFFRCLVPPEMRKEKIVLIPLRIGKYKGLPLGIDILEMIHRRDPSIIAISFGNAPSSLVPMYVDHRGVISNSELLELYNRASVFILPSLVEGYGLTALEAMICGAAVVTTDNEGIDEFAKDGVNAIIVKEFDPESIADEVLKLLQSDGTRINLVRNGIRTASLFNPNNMLSSFLKLIKEGES